MRQQNESHEFNLFKIRSVSDPRMFTIIQPTKWSKRPSLSDTQTRNELNELLIRENFPYRYAKIHALVLFLVILVQLILQQVEFYQIPEFKSAIYASMAVSFYGFINIIILGILSK